MPSKSPRASPRSPSPPSAPRCPPWSSPRPPHADSVRIHDIQGTTRTSPLAGQQVTDVAGIVTGVRTYGSSTRLLDPGSQGGRQPGHQRGRLRLHQLPADGRRRRRGHGRGHGRGVRAGRHLVRQPVGDARSPADGHRRLQRQRRPGRDRHRRQVRAERRTPRPATPPRAARSTASRSAPAKYALDHYESLEGMNVQVADTRVVAATDPFTELWVTVKPRENANRRGGTVYGSYTSQNTGRLQIQSLGAVADFPKANVGDVLKGTTAGPLDYNQFGGYTLVANQLGTLKQGGLERETTRKQARGELAVATYNVENLDPSDATFADARGRDRAQPPVARHRVPGGDPGQQRRDERRHGRRRPDGAEADRRDRGGGRPGVRLALHRPGEPRGRRRARRQHPPGLPVQPRAGLLHRPRGRRRHDRRRCDEVRTARRG